MLILKSFGQGEELLTNELMIFETSNKNYDVIFLNTLETPNKERLINQTKSIGVLSLATIGLLYVLPTDFTAWDNKKKNWLSNYKGSVVERGIVWDSDNLFFNFVAHPYVGSIYYIAARKSGYNEFQSFLYSFCLSTIFWEFGIESFFEAPSIQDLLITPGLGSLLGEYLFRLENEIIKNQGKVLGSSILGKTTLILIDPVGTLANVLGYKDNEVMGSWTFVKNQENNLQLGYMLQVTF